MRNVLTIVATVMTLVAFGQGTFWQPSVGSGRTDKDQWKNIRHAQWALDQDKLEHTLKQTNGKIRLEMPMPDGEFLEFDLQEASIMASGLQEKYPEIRTYKGTNTKGETARFDVTPGGLHGIVFSQSGTVYIDPVDQGSREYLSYYRSDYKRFMELPVFDELPILTRKVTLPRKVNKPRELNRVNGTVLKSYRIAIAADHTYTGFHGGTVADALAAIVTTMNRVTGIYENELAVTFVIVEDNDRIIYPNESTDPYDGLSTQRTLDENQSNLDLVIGNANYDIGHVFTTGSGGLAGLGVVCRARDKARGTTGISQPTGDPFDVDFVAHEIGHQFGGNHTFNGTTGECEGSNRNGSTAFEPGSGTTIMAYAGICPGQNIQNRSDPYFHAGSLEEILTYIIDSQGASCAVTSNTGNTPPQVNGPQGDFTIPINTPFFLTASGSDADGDELTYNWEQYDLGIAGHPNSPSPTAPLFRSYSPTSDPTRYFPRLQDLLAGATVLGERLPDISRALNFRVTARDNNPAGGGVNEDNIVINSTAEAGPFVVTSQNSPETYAGGSVQLVEWDVAGTDKAPVSLESVQILLSTDGGENFTEVLSSATPNDGAEFVTLPNASINNARIMVAAVNNIFFNVSQSGFEIEENTEPGFSLLISEVPGISCGDVLDFTISAVTVNGFSGDISLSFDSDDTGLAVSTSANTLSPGESITLTIENQGSFGDKSLDVEGISGDARSETTLPLSFLSVVSQAPGSALPADESTGIDLLPAFTWEALPGVSAYNFTLALDENYEDVVFQSLNQAGTSVSLSEELSSNTAYFWKVSGVNGCGEGPATEQRFITAFVQGVDLMASDLPVNIFSEATVTSSINVTQDFILSDVNVENLDISHTWVEDLTITLTSPMGTTVTLFQEQCGDTDDILLSYDDAATIGTLCPPNDGGKYQPLEPLSSFNEELVTGVWTLSVSDGAAGDEGTINGWVLALQTPTEAISMFATSTVFDQVDLVWNDITVDSGYEIEQAIGDGDFEKVGETNQNVVATSITGLEPSTNYRFRVRAIVANGFSEYSNISPVTTLPQPPASPSNLTSSQTSNRRILLSWTDNSDVEEGFIVERSTNGTDYTEQARVIENITSYIDNSFEDGVQYFYRVKAFNVSGESDPSEVATFLVLDLDDTEPDMIYPNPARAHITVNATLTQAFRVLHITDLNGKRVWRQSLERGQPTQIDLSTLVPGVYIMQLSNGDNRRQFKFVKSR